MVGTEKQIKYAEDIKAEIVKVFDEAWEIAKDTFTTVEIAKRQKELLDERKQAVVNNESAKEIIEKYANVLKIKDRGDKFDIYSKEFGTKVFSKAYKETATVYGTDVKLYR